MNKKLIECFISFFPLLFFSLVHFILVLLIRVLNIKRPYMQLAWTNKIKLLCIIIFDIEHKN